MLERLRAKGQAARWIAGVLAILVYLLVLTLHQFAPACAGCPDPLRLISVSARYGFTLVAPLAGLLFYLALRLAERWRNLSGWGAIVGMGIFGLALVGLWASGQSEAAVVSGLLPWNDPLAYYVDALKLLEGNTLSTFSARRPMFAGLLAALLGLTGRNLQAALAVLVGINAVACYLLGREIQRTHGAASATLAWVILFLYYRRFAGSGLTENLGLALGVLGLALLWRGAGRPSPSASAKDLLDESGNGKESEHSGQHQRLAPLELWLGLWLLTLGLNARAGTFLVLPALAGWLIGLFIQPGRGRSWLWFSLALSASAILAGFLLNFLLFRLLAPAGAMPFSNFSYSLYGVAVGGKGWTQYGRDHPELNQLPEPERARRVYQLAFDEIRRNPLNLVRGALRQWQLFFTDPWFGAYSYISSDTEWVATAAHLGLYGLSALGLAGVLRKRKDPYSVFIALAFLGLLISVPFVPPEDAHKMRPYAATIAILALLPALGLHRLLSLPGLRHLRGAPLPFSGQATAAFGVALVLLTFGGAALVRLTSHPTPLPSVTCPAGQQAAVIRLVAGSYINILANEDPRPDWLPNFHYGIYKIRIHNLPNSDAIQEFEQIEPPATISPVLDLISGQRLWLLAETRLIPPAPGLLAICGEAGKTSQGEPSMFFIAKTITPLQNP